MTDGERELSSADLAVEDLLVNDELLEAVAEGILSQQAEIPVRSP